MNFKRKGFFTVMALVSLVFMCCTSHVCALPHYASSEMDISYNVENNGCGNGTYIKFGSISEYLKQEHYAQTNALESLIVRICKKYHATKVVFDGIEYAYNESTATLTITQVDKSLYATAQQFVIIGLNLNNIDDIDEKICEVRNSSLERLIKEGLGDSYKRGEYNTRRRYKQIEAEEKAKRPLPRLVTRPLKTIIIRGNIIRIGDDFCNGNDHITNSPIIISNEYDHFPQLETIDMSKSNVCEICAGAFPGCKHIDNLIYPANGSLKRISRTAFEGAPIKIDTLLLQEVCTDPRRPINEPPIRLSCCATQ